MAIELLMYSLSLSTSENITGRSLEKKYFYESLAKVNKNKESTAMSLNFADGVDNHFEKVRVNSHPKTYLRCESESEFITCHKFPL